MIDFLGHMRADRRLARTRLGLNFPSPVGLGVGIDTEGRATPALERFGFGFLELGPITVRPIRDAGGVVRRVDREEIELADPPDNPGVDGLLVRWLRRDRRPRVPTIARLAIRPGTSDSEAAESCREMAGRLATFVDAISMSLPGLVSDPPALRDVLRAVRSTRAASPDPAVLARGACGRDGVIPGRDGS